MAKRLSAEWQAEWRERLARFRDWIGTSADFCRHGGISRSSLSLWSRRLRVQSGPGPERDSRSSRPCQKWIVLALQPSESAWPRPRNVSCDSSKLISDAHRSTIQQGAP
jgi:hypothetical protein